MSALLWKTGNQLLISVDSGSSLSFVREVPNPSGPGNPTPWPKGDPLRSCL